MTFAQSSSKQISSGANPNLPFSAAVKADGLIYVAGTLGPAPARSPRRHQGADQADARQHQRDAEDRRLQPGQRRERAGLPAQRQRLRGDERGLRDATGRRIRRRARRSSSRSRSRSPTGWSRSRWSPSRTAASGSSSTRATGSKSPNPYSYGIKTRQHAVPVRAGQPQRQGQHARQGRHHRADQDRARQRRRDSQGSRHELRRRRVVAHLPHRRHDVPGMNTVYRTYFPTDAAGARDGEGAD